jgi:tRNA pseudouridine(55) synthase
MARQRKGLPVHGWLVLDKPQGMTSTQAVGKVKHLYQAAKAGHAGTLDPLATGMLPIALGEATKTVPFVVDGTKEYRFTVRFGAETDTDDAEGKVTGESDRRATRAEIEAALQGFVGAILQVPPRYSAVRVAGERAYDLARDSQDFELAPREVRIARLTLVDMPDRDRCVIEAECRPYRGLAAYAGRRLRRDPVNFARQARGAGPGRRGPRGTAGRARTRRDGVARYSSARRQRNRRGKVEAGAIRAVAGTGCAHCHRARLRRLARDARGARRGQPRGTQAPTHLQSVPLGLQILLASRRIMPIVPPVRSRLPFAPRALSRPCWTTSRPGPTQTPKL